MSGGTEVFWTDSFFVNFQEDVAALAVDENGVITGPLIDDASVKTVCVTDPSA